MLPMPSAKPESPFFGSGPTKKIPGWKIDLLEGALVARSHRSSVGVARIYQVLSLIRSIHNIPDDYKVAILPGSATGAIECALWSFLGNRGVDVFAWDVFGKLWVTDVVNQLRLPDQRTFTAPFGQIPDFRAYQPDRDVVFTWNGTTAGVCVPNLDWIPDQRLGLSICDATSAAFAVELDWSKLDITCFAWQKGLGSEAAHGVLVLSPKAVQHLQEYTPKWPIPRLFRLTKDGNLISDLYDGKTLNTPSMICVEDCLKSLLWAEKLGGIKGLATKTKENFNVVKAWLNNHPHLEFLSEKEETVSPVSVCFQLKDETLSGEEKSQRIDAVTSKIAELKVAYDIKNHYLAPPSFRIWCGPTVEASDIKALLPWIDWALEEQMKG